MRSRKRRTSLRCHSVGASPARYWSKACQRLVMACASARWLRLLVEEQLVLLDGRRIVACKVGVLRLLRPGDCSVEFGQGVCLVAVGGVGVEPGTEAGGVVHRREVDVAEVLEVAVDVLRQ